jgi:hypothetical protein
MPHHAQLASIGPGHVLVLLAIQFRLVDLRTRRREILLTVVKVNFGASLWALRTARDNLFWPCSTKHNGVYTLRCQSQPSWWWVLNGAVYYTPADCSALVMGEDSSRSIFPESRSARRATWLMPVGVSGTRSRPSPLVAAFRLGCNRPRRV